MIARLWHGIVPKEKSGNYHDFLLDTGLKDYYKIAGNKGVFLLKNDEENITHFYTFTLWDNVESIKAFAGEEYNKARYYPEDKDYLLEFEEHVTHFDVLELPEILVEKK